MEDRVKVANRRFFDEVAEVYEKVDTRRSDAESWWIDGVVQELRRRAVGGLLLDLGCGTGLMMRYGVLHFEKVYGVDLSPKIVAKGRGHGHVLCGDITNLPFQNGTFDIATCFATLHHCYEIRPVLEEAYRILKEGGLLYTDHDLNKSFVASHPWLIRSYRGLFGMRDRYLQKRQGLDREVYELTEFHSGGLDAETIKRQLGEIGFREIEVRYHWLGLNRWVTKALYPMRSRRFSPTSAPIISILARK